MNILIIGATAREHALTWKLAKSKDVEKIFVAPGNAGTATEPVTSNIPIDISNTEKLLEFSKENNVEMVLVNDESLIEKDIVTSFKEYGIPCLGPSSKSYQVEKSESLAKNLITKYKIPTTSYRVFENAENAKEYASEQPYPMLIKQDDTESEKATIIVNSIKEANEVINRFFLSQGKTARVVIEQIVKGTEVSVNYLTDSKTLLSLGASQVEKRLQTGNRGELTNGMGIISPEQTITDKIEDNITTTIIQPIIEALQKEKLSFYGFLNANVIITSKGEAKLLDFKFRLADPEACAILIRMKSDLLPLLIATTNKSMHATDPIKWEERCALGVTIVDKCYPQPLQTPQNIFGTINTPSRNCKIFHAGTKSKNNETFTSENVVFCVVTLGDTIIKARRQAYALVNHIQWKTKYYRHDIGYKAEFAETEK